MAYYRNLRPTQAADPGVVLLAGNFAVGATGAVGTIEGASVASVTRNSEGQYTIVFRGTGPLDLLAGPFIALRVGADEDVFAVVESFNEATRTLVIQMLEQDGTIVDVASGGNISFMLMVQPNTTLTR